jgi:succinate-semialdehyde dehydrogenase/glutarate-semialdehyde dehydrogenase
MTNVNPATGEALPSYEDHDEAAVESVLAAADRRASEWARRPTEERQVLAERLGERLEAEAEDLGEVMVREMGKPRAQAVAEVEKCAWVCEYYAERAAEHLQNEHVGTVPGAKTYVSHEPLGPLLAVMPWNFPFWQVFRFAVPALTAGNVAVLKHAPNVPECSERIAETFARAGYPDGVFEAVRVPEERVDGIIADDRIRGVTLTGSTAAGRSVAAESGAHLKPSVLELGGSDPFVVLEDAPVEATARAAVTARTHNSGQSCIAAKRFLVDETIAESFTDALVEGMASLTVGDPMDEETDVGPMAREDLLEGLHRQVSASVDAGATVLCGGEPVEGDGYFYRPTVLADVPEDAPAATEELFGPVAAVFEVADAEEAVERANDSDYGLGASVWTGDPDRGERVARRIESGVAFVNEIVKSDPRVPFGGTKQSGYGSELGAHGIREFTTPKTYRVRDEPEETP